MKKRMFILIVVYLCVLSGCSPVSPTYPFVNPAEEVVSIELLHNRNEHGIGTDERNIYPIYSLNEDELMTFMSDIYELETDRRTPPSWGYGDYIAKVTYSNGDVEMLGSLHIEFISHEGDELIGYGQYHFEDRDAFIQVLEKYCDLPDEV